MAETEETGSKEPGAADLKVTEPTPGPTPGPGPQARPEDPQPAPRPSAILPIFGGVIAAVVGFGLAQVVPKGWPLAIPATEDSQQEDAQLKAAITEVDALKTQILELTQRLDATSAMAERIAKLEAAPTPAPVDTSALDARIAALEARPAGTGGDPAAVAQLRAEVETLKAGSAGIVSPEVQASLDAKVKETEAKLAAIEEAAKASAGAAVSRAAVRQIAAALDSGTPFAAALADLNMADLPPVLADNAATGLPTLQSLQAAFPDAARAALDASLRADLGATWTERLTNFLRTQTGARTLTPREGTDPDAVLSRAEAAAAAGDLTSALTEIKALPPEGLVPLAAWQARAQLRLDAEAAVQALIAKAG